MELFDHEIAGWLEPGDTIYLKDGTHGRVKTIEAHSGECEHAGQVFIELESGWTGEFDFNDPIMYFGADEGTTFDDECASCNAGDHGQRQEGYSYCKCCGYVYGMPVPLT